MNTIQYKIGDTVILKSGGPIMTIVDIDINTNQVECCWFNEQNDRQIEEFPIDTIKLIDE